MDEFLSSTLMKLNNNNFNELNLIIGNESCDLDSAISAIVYATYLFWQHNQVKCKVCTKAYRDGTLVKDDVFVPILNVDRADYELKTEVAYLLKKKGISVSNLVFRDDNNLQELLNNSKSKVVLVDHHVLAKKDEFLAPFVTEIIDHRPLDKSKWTYKEDTRSTIEIVGSCATLVAQRIKDLSSLVAKDVDFFKAYPVCGEFLHATIILDTVNFSKEVNKATPHDEEIIQFLESVIKPADYKAERQRILDTLVEARKDVSNLSAAQLLRKDVKIVGNVLVPSFPILVKEFLDRPSALEAVTEALSRNNCDIALLLGMDLTAGLKRDTALYSPKSPEKAVKLGEHLLQWRSPDLQLQADKASCIYYHQLNLSASRKQYIPPVTQWIQTSTK
ncbi:exopolyphosphatase PRUNE1 [Helicoverpa zea]|uniref:exopolyphosphatase PRUNE1 n=1 Tax=Helicoverpa zea TaxID=7113 RepID=UPI001F580AE5|nr:exopolyphosphatase PRUNE1 [Helicoverpa zea]